MVKMRDTPYMNYLFLYVFCFQIIFTNSRSSTVWKLVPEEGIIVDASDDEKLNLEDDPIFKIVTSTVYHGNMWIKTGNYNVYDTDCQNNDQYRESSDETVALETNGDNIDDEYLDCGKAVNYTYYDNLVGVARRHRHPNVPEPQVALIFTKKKTYKNGGVVSEFDIKALEKRLKKAKREKPKSVQLYNQIGNYWRIKGDTRLSIECFRRALAVSPYNAEVLLNLARVLFTLQYLDDAIYLTRRSLEVQPPDRSAWQQYFTLGEIFKAYGHYQEAAVHLKHSLDLRPDFEPAAAALKDIASIPEASLHVYTLLIIICLVMGVLLVIMSSVDNGAEAEEHKTQRHFNRAMAMRSLRGVTFSAHGSRTSRRKGGS